MDLKIGNDMEEQKQFKVGDRVRIKGDSTKTEHVIEQITEGYYWLAGTDAFIAGRWLEKLEPCDPKTAFLSELKELLKKYGASIYDYERYKLIIDFDNGDSVSWYWGDKPIRECALTPDNIMDYDKE